MHIIIGALALSALVFLILVTTSKKNIPDPKAGKRATQTFLWSQRPK